MAHVLQLKHFTTSFSILLILLTLAIPKTICAAEEKKGDAKVYGQFTILSDYIQRGLTQTNHDPAFQSGFGYNFGGQGQLGVWGTNVQYENESTHLDLRGIANYKFSFGQSFDIKPGIEIDKFYKNSARDGITFDLDFGVYGYRILYQYIGKWEASGTSAHYFAGKKEWDWIGASAGYTMLSGDYKSYLDLKGYLQWKTSKGIYSLQMTTITEGSQFGSQGNLALVLGVEVNF